ncbi:FAD:protein FMN transferase [Halosquirtibacter xylanolyticus]|uniref:FAD:protein FMN transferase n=1 Tax=Halosquirtibacter xylanolyticus TaxID=3374599 RepID=UPI003749941F|nr:FAD:protein FMN transferase [Prolixibacteraceae bacterium]
MKQFRIWLALSLCVTCLWGCSTSSSKYVFNSGAVYGTLYHIVYESPDGDDMHEEIKAEMQRFDNSLSTFNPVSTISKINKNEPTELDPFFLKCYNKAVLVSEATEGAFDMTVAPMVNAWGFGFKNREKVTPEVVDSLKSIVGYQKVHLKEGKIIKQDPRTMLDASAIAKGFSVDVVAEYLKNKGCKNFMVEIGGEIVAQGVNSKNKTWVIGINKPKEDMPLDHQELQATVSLKNCGMATSGNYRNFYVDGGKKYAHTIDPRSGYPVQHSLLSSSVMAPTCMEADAFATSFMVLGVEKSQEIVLANPKLEAFFIYADDKGNTKIWSSPGFKKQIKDIIE